MLAEQFDTIRREYWKYMSRMLESKYSAKSNSKESWEKYKL